MLTIRQGLGSYCFGGFNAKARDVRTELARNALTELNLFADLLPTPRPSDVVWAEEEQAAIRQLTDGNAILSRHEQLYASPEFQHVRVYNFLKAIQDAFRCVIDPTTGLQREMVCWASAALLLGDHFVFGDGVGILARSKRLPDKTRWGDYDSVAFFFNTYSRGIHEYLILPYLKGDLK